MCLLEPRDIPVYSIDVAMERVDAVLGCIPLEEIGRVVRLVSSFPGYAEALRTRLDAVLGWLNVEWNIKGTMELLSSRRMKTLSALAGVAEPEVGIGVAVVDKSSITALKGRGGYTPYCTCLRPR